MDKNKLIVGPEAEIVYDSMVGKNAEGAMPIGTRILKCDGEPGDVHPVGTIGEVLGSADVKDICTDLGVKYAYIIQFDNTKYPVFIIDRKIREVVL